MQQKEINRVPQRWDFPFYRSLWNQAMLFTLLPVSLIFLGIGIWISYNCPKPIVGIIILIGCFIIVVASVSYSIGGLVRQLERKRLNINLLDQQLLKMSRMAATTKVTRDFLSHIKDVFINIDSTVAWAKNLTNGNNRQELEESLLQIKSEAERAIRSIDKLFSFTRLPEHQWTIQDIDINQLLTDMLVLFASELRSRAIHLEQRFESQLPSIRSNFSRLYQAIQNLFLAVISDIEQQGELLIKTATDEEGVRIEVTYKSLHFDEHVFSQLIDPAYALQSQEPGPWLALSMYHVERVSGQIKAEKTDSGLKFILTFPYKIDKPLTPPSPRSFFKGL